jgi:S1-C subfamily serine protease
MTLRSTAPHPPELDPPTTAPLAPEVQARVAASTVKVSGVACSRRQDGSGFAAGPELVATNAHVVAGVAYPEVRRPDGRRLAARVVLFDPARDLALLQVPGLGQTPLPVGNVDVGEAAAVFGHPGGQDALEISPATVTSQAAVVGNDLYERDHARRQLLFLAARLAPGDSGGALVDPSGAVVGVAFAVAPGQHTTAYALSSAELRAVLAAPRQARASTGACVG